MSYTNLRDFISVLEQKGLLRRVKAEVSQDMEIAEITDRVTKAGGPALLFENVKGHQTPVAINLFGTLERMQLALGADSLDSIADRIRELLKPKTPTTLMEKIMMLPKLAELGSFIPKPVTSAPCQEVVEKDNPSLESLPVLRCWPGDGGRYITFGMVVTKSPTTGMRNVGLYRVQVYNERTAGMHWQIHKDGARHQAAGLEKKQARIDCAIVLGADPATMFAASAPLPPDVDELLFAGFLRKKPVETVRAVTVDVEVPAQAEIVLEGWVDPSESRLEGPFGDHTGYYSAPEQYPVFHLTAITRRGDAIYPTIIVGKPLQEDYFLGKATERIFLPLLQMMLPEIADMNFPAEGVFHNCLIVSIKKSYPGHARKVLSALWGLGLMMLTKLIIVVDASVNVQNLSEVAFIVTNNIDAKRDIVITEGPVDDLDHASIQYRFGGKMGIDATRKLPAEGPSRPWPEEIAMSPEIKEQVTRRWKEYGIDTK